MDFPHLFATTIMGFAGLCFYFLPSIVAAYYEKRQVTGIFLLNLLLGWTILGWVVALIWSSSRDAGNEKK